MPRNQTEFLFIVVPTEIALVESHSASVESAFSWMPFFWFSALLDVGSAVAVGLL